MKIGQEPSKWKEANINPIFKKGVRIKRSYYRGISWCSDISKIMETLVKKIMQMRLIEYNLINNNQHGFVQFKSCVKNLLECIDIISDAINQGYLVDLIFLDFA